MAPASLRLTWAEEIERWLPLLRPAHIRVIEGKEDRLRPGDEPRVSDGWGRLVCGRASMPLTCCIGAASRCLPPFLLA